MSGDGPTAADPDAIEEHALSALQDPKLPRWHPSSLRGAWWAARAVRLAKRDLAANGVRTKVAPPPPLPWGARTGVNGVLARLAPTCLERAVVMQTWLTAHGAAVDVVIGVSADNSAGTRAHAWLDGLAPPEEYAKYREIHRIPPRRA